MPHQLRCQTPFPAIWFVDDNAPDQRGIVGKLREVRVLQIKAQGVALVAKLRGNKPVMVVPPGEKQISRISRFIPVNTFVAVTA